MLTFTRLWNIQARMQNKGLRFTTSFLFPMHSYEGKYLDIVQCCSPIGILFLNKQQIQDLLVNIYGPTLFARIKFDEYDVEELRFCLCRTYGLSVGDWLGLIRAEQVVIRQDTNAIHYRGQGNGNSKSEASLVWSFKP